MAGKRKNTPSQASRVLAERESERCRHRRHRSGRKTKRLKPSQRTSGSERTKQYGRGRDMTRRAENRLRRIMRFEERDTTEVNLICYEPRDPECFIRSSGDAAQMSSDDGDHKLFQEVIDLRDVQNFMVLGYA